MNRQEVDRLKLKLPGVFGIIKDGVIVYIGSTLKPIEVEMRDKKYYKYNDDRYKVVSLHVLQVNENRHQLETYQILAMIEAKPRDNGEFQFSENKEEQPDWAKIRTYLARGRW